MIKTIKKIDLQGNEVWQEVCVCNRCKNELGPSDFVYETKWTAWHPVKIKPGMAYGFGAENNQVKHICEACRPEVEAFLNGALNNSRRINNSTVSRMMSQFENEATEELKKYRRNCLCSREAAEAIDMILVMRGTI